MATGGFGFEDDYFDDNAESVDYQVDSPTGSIEEGENEVDALRSNISNTLNIFEPQREDQYIECLQNETVQVSKMTVNFEELNKLRKRSLLHFARELE